MRRHRGTVAAAVAGLALAAVPASAAGETFDVTQLGDHAGACDARCSLREAVIAANSDGAEDRVRLPAGRHELTIRGLGEDSAEEGDLDVRPGGLRIIGEGMKETVIDANGIDRVLNIIGFPGTSLLLRDLTLTGGKSRQEYEGAGMKVESSTTATLVRARVAKNTTAANAGADGAGLFVDGTAVLRRSVVSDNVNRTGDGGGIENRGTLELHDSTVAGNSALAADGAGISMNGADSLLLDGSTVSGNRAGGPEAGGDGAGVYAPGSATVSTVTNSTISGNLARGSSAQGGGFYVRGEITLTNATVAFNEARGDAGGGIYAITGADVNLLNTIVAANVGEAGAQNCGGSAAPDTLGNNLENRDTCQLTAPDDVPDGQPRLGPLARNGGPTRTHALQPGSDAINAGNMIGCPPADQRGVPRPQGPACDIGAFERRP